MHYCLTSVIQAYERGNILPILMLELQWGGTAHAPGNGHYVSMVASSFPEQQVHVMADAAHLDEMRTFPEVTSHSNVTFTPITRHRHAKALYKPHIVSPGLFRHELGVVWRAVAAVPRSEPILLILLSCTSTAILAARAAASLLRRRVRIQALLHGDLNGIVGWRSRNPLVRRFDLHAILSRPPRDTRFVTYEAAITRELQRIVPAATALLDTVAHHTISSEIEACRPVALREPLRVGLVGGATEAKGITAFLETARLFRARHGQRVEFHLVGSARDYPPERFRDLAHHVQPVALPRAEYVARLRELHYVMLPLQEQYYRLSASGALLDAVTWLKPIIATRIPIVEDLFAAGGDIGHMCDDVASMQAALEEVLLRPDPARYARQVEALRALRESRTPRATAPAYREMVRTGFAPAT